jgi:hypothetical protein
MAQRALATPADHQYANALALIIEPDDSQAQVLQHALVERIGGTLRIVQSTDAAFTAFGESLPDVILISPLIAPSEEERIVAHLGTLGGDASHVRLLSIPRFGDAPQANGKRRWFGAHPKRNANGGCDPVSFANEVAEYLATASTRRQNSQPAAGTVATASDTLAGLRIEHIEQLFERTHDFFVAASSSADEQQAPPPRAEQHEPAQAAGEASGVIEQVMPSAEPQAPASDAPNETVPEVSIPERNDMPTATARESHVDTPADSRLPRFLVPDERVPLPLRALLDEADGCLKMSFLTGSGACAVRTLDLLLAEQGFSGNDRADQIQQLGKKHPAIAEAFLRGLSIVTNNPSGAWDEARVRLVIAILKAIAYEIYVLGPERKERAAYVIELLERFKSSPKN